VRDGQDPPVVGALGRLAELPKEEVRQVHRALSPRRRLASRGLSFPGGCELELKVDIQRRGDQQSAE
jgi:hypothetical protein